MANGFERIRVIKDRNFTVINNTILKDRRVSCKARGLFQTIMSLPDDWDFTIGGIVAILPEGKDAVYNIIRELRRWGYCTLEVIRTGGRFAGSEYVFWEAGFSTDGHPYRDSPYADNPDTGLSDTENPTQLNTHRDFKTHRGSNTQATKLCALEIPYEDMKALEVGLKQEIMGNENLLLDVPEWAQWLQVYSEVMTAGITPGKMLEAYKFLAAQDWRKSRVTPNVLRNNIFNIDRLKAKEIQPRLPELDVGKYYPPEGE